MGGGRSVVDVENANGHHYRESDEDHGEEEIFAEEWNGKTSGRNNFCEEEKEHGE